MTDTVRIKGLDYLEVANQNGINHLSVGAPVVLVDGLYGNDSIMVKPGEILGEIAIASVIHDVPAMVVCSHVKGHIQAGYAGAIKNIAMGGVSSKHRTCGWKCGRGAMHTIGEGDAGLGQKEMRTLLSVHGDMPARCHQVCERGIEMGQQ